MKRFYKASTRKHPKGYAAVVVRITGRKFDSLMYYKVFTKRNQAYRNAKEIESTLNDIEEKLNKE
jgi:hypothetical protein